MSSTDLRRRGRSRSLADWAMLAEAAVALIAMRLTVKRVPFRRLARVVGLVEGDVAQGREFREDQTPAPVGRAVDAVANRLPWESTCLMRALAAAALLRRRGIGATVAFGVMRDESKPGTFAAHAWISSGGRILTGGESRSQFTEVGRYTLPVQR